MYCSLQNNYLILCKPIRLSMALLLPSLSPYMHGWTACCAAASRHTSIMPVWKQLHVFLRHTAANLNPVRYNPAGDHGGQNTCRQPSAAVQQWGVPGDLQCRLRRLEAAVLPHWSVQRNRWVHARMDGLQAGACLIGQWCV
jgi:hypothetical protein